MVEIVNQAQSMDIPYSTKFTHKTIAVTPSAAHCPPKPVIMVIFFNQFHLFGISVADCNDSTPHVNVGTHVVIINFSVYEVTIVSTC